MFLLPGVAVVSALVLVVGLSFWLRRHLEDDVQSRWARVLRIRTPGLTRILAVFDGLRAVSLVAIPAAALLFIATLDLTVSRLSVKQEGHRGSQSGQKVGLPLTGQTSPVPSPSSTEPTTDGTTAPGAPTTTLPCRNSTDPVCGPFRWDPPPGPNRPVEIEVARSPNAPHVGEQVTVSVHVGEADSKVGGVTVSFGDEKALILPPATAVACDSAAPAGPWTPPAATPDEKVSTFGHIYTRPGTYTIDVYAASADFLDTKCPPSPYASQGTSSFPIRVI